MFKVKLKNKKLWIGLALLLLVLLLLYFYTYFFSKDHKKVIYQDAQRRLYLTDKKEYKPGRLQWRLVYEDLKTGNRWFILGNSRKGASDKEMTRVVLNTIEKGKSSSFDQVESIGVTLRPAKTDVHSNLIGKKSVGELLPSEWDIGEMNGLFEMPK